MDSHMHQSHVGGGRNLIWNTVLGINAVSVCLFLCVCVWWWVCLCVALLCLCWRSAALSFLRAPLAWLILDYTDNTACAISMSVNCSLSNAAGAHPVEPVEQFLLHPSPHLMVHRACHITNTRFNMTCCPAAGLTMASLLIWKWDEMGFCQISQ